MKNVHAIAKCNELIEQAGGYSALILAKGDRACDRRQAFNRHFQSAVSSILRAKYDNDPRWTALAVSEAEEALR